MSPEQVLGQPVGPASDVFSFGVILYELLTGRSPFARDTAVETLAAAVREHPPPIDADAAAERRLLWPIVERCLAKDPSQRFATAGDLTTAIGEHRDESKRSAGAVPAVERRGVTVLSIELVHRAHDAVPDPERLKRAFVRAAAEIRRLIEAHGGRVEQAGGATMHALFGAPVAHPDDPARALAAGADCVRWAERDAHDAVGVALRVGVESGHAIVDLGSAPHVSPTVGACVSVAARLRQLASPGEVVAGPACRVAAEDRAIFDAPVEIDDPSVGRIAAARYLGVRPVATRPALPLVGRGAELTLLQAAWQRARSGRSTLVVVSGPPGQGKSRLIEEFTASIEADALVRVARIRVAGALAARNPLGALLGVPGTTLSTESLSSSLTALFPDASERQHIAAALGRSAGLGASGELAARSKAEVQDELVNGWRRYVAAMTRERPLVFCIEDLHWAEAEAVQLVDRLTYASDLPLMVVATARPEFRAAALLRSGGNRFFMALDALGPDHALELARLAGASDAAATDRAAGNPLFIVELARARTHGSTGVPMTIEGAIGARLDELPVQDRELLQRAAIVGDAFTVREASVVSARSVDHVARTLDRLVESMFLDPAPGGARFGHALIRDVAYGRLPATERLRLHVLYAREALSPDDVEAAAHHLWQAVGSDEAAWVWEGSDEAAQLRVEARQALVAAARRYGARCAYQRGIECCERAATLCSDDLQRAEVERLLADISVAGGDADEAVLHYIRSRALFREAGDAPPSLYPDFLEPAIYTAGMFREAPGTAVVEEWLQEGEAVARRAGDASALARILALRAYRAHDIARLSQALRLIDAIPDPTPLQTCLVHAAILENRAAEFAAARDTYRRLDAVALAAGRADRDFEFRGILALNVGEIDEAARMADLFIAATAGRGPHLKTHAYREQAHVLLARGDWRALCELADRTDELVARSPDTAFCYAVTTVRAFALVAHAIEARRGDAERLLPPVEVPLQAEPLERESLLMLVYGALGRRDAVRSLVGELDRTRTRRFWFFLRTYAVALTMLEAWDELEPALEELKAVANRSAYVAAMVDAMREESRAARGGERASHAALRSRGYTGWSQLIGFRSNPKSDRPADRTITRRGP
jgi:class 3 adenylate cyclase